MIAYTNHTILLVDDEDNVLQALERFLRREGYSTITAVSGEEGLEKFKEKPVSMVISDLKMPGMDGIEFLKKIRELSPDSIRIILTGYANLSAALRSINVGEVYRFITKPWKEEEIREVIREGFARGNLAHMIKDENINLQNKVAELQKGLSEGSNKIQLLYGELKNNFLSTITALAAAVEAKDPYTRGHSEMVARFASAIAKKMGLPKDKIDGIQVAGILHDIGKIGISEKILLKPGKLTPEEKKIMDTHPVLGAKILEPINFPWETISYVYHHQEQFDGKGYPVGLKGEDIPLGARILTVADTYQAMTSDRAYRKALPKATAIKILKEAAGSQLDPEITSLFLDLLEKDPGSISQPSEIIVEPLQQEDHAVLIVDDEENIVSSLNRILRRGDSLKILTATSGKEGLAKMKEGPVSLVISDQRMPEMSGAEFLQKVNEMYPDTIRIMLTGYADIKAAVEAINKGEVYKYISKPWSVMDIRHTVQQALNLYNLRKKNRILNEEMLEQNKNLILLTKDLEGQVILDCLTGLYNRRHLEGILGKEIKSSERYGHPLSLIMADIDDFKQINDNYGHQAGDKVLKAVAAIIKEGIRQEVDTPCRYGGEEFAVVLPQADIHSAIATAERLRLKAAGQYFETPLKKLQVTVSFGIAQLHNGMLEEALIEKADKNLYQAKEQGKNRVVG